RIPAPSAASRSRRTPTVQPGAGDPAAPCGHPPPARLAGSAGPRAEGSAAEVPGEVVDPPHHRLHQLVGDRGAGADLGQVPPTDDHQPAMPLVDVALAEHLV